MKHFYRFLGAALCLMTFWTSGYAINPYLQGDVNDDARVSIDDVTDLINALLDGTTSDFDGYGDVNGDGRVSIDDLTEVINILLGHLPKNENTVSVSLPEEAPITVNDVVVMGYGTEIAQSTAPRHLRDASTRYYVTDANAISVFTRDGKLVYESYVSLDVNNHERTVAVDALETAYTMLIPIFSHVFDATPDYIYTDLKNLLAELYETQALASAIDRSIVSRGYFEINDVETEYQAAVDKIIEKLGLRDNFLSDAARGRTTFKNPSEPSIPHGEYGHVGLKLRLKSGEWVPDDAPGDGGGSWIKGSGSAFESYGGIWHCNLTAYNSGRFSYTSWTRGYIDDNGSVQFYSTDPADLLEHILKPQRVATFMKTFKSWDGLKDYISDSWKLITDPDFGFADMTWDCTKVKFDMDFTTPRDVVIVCGPDQQVMLFYNLLKGIVEPMTKELFKNLDKASKEEGEFFTIFCAELVMDLEYSTRFTAIWQGEGSLKEKAKAIAELTWPKLQESAKKYVQERIDLWTKDRCIEVFGFVDVAKLETGIENITKNMNKYLKVVEEVGDGLLSTLGVLEGFNDVYGSGYYEMDLDFNSIPINTMDFTVGDVSFTMVEVKGGSFLMGASMKQINDAHEDEYPLHNVTLNDYYIGQTEVTQELWKTVMGSVPGSYKNSKYPVGGVSWLECQQFIFKLNEMTGENFRLPTEAEWECAARGSRGAKECLYAGSNTLDNVAWYNGNSSLRPHEVATKIPNQLALYDMSGNVMEWCSDWYGAYSSDALTNPTGPSEGTQRVCRGGGWGYGSDLCRVSCRNSFAPSNSMNENLGLRLVWEPKTSETFTVNGVTFKMVHVDGGTFMMGGTAEQGSDAWSDREYPVHQVTLSSYYMGQTEVTQALWQAVMGSNPSLFTGDPNRPVECVSWNDCQIFISKLSELTGYSFRLPTEAEWEFAARGGNKSRMYRFAGSNNIDDVAWYKSNSNNSTHPVATKAPNELGIYDMSGNISEWCYDWYGIYNGGEQTNPMGPSSGQWRICRGGDWHYESNFLRVSFRHYNYPTNSWEHDGLRLALDDSTPSIDEHEYVDLGLPSGTLWATCNVGASAPEEYGDYFAWGEIVPKEYYGWDTYIWCNGTWNSMTKYCIDSYFGTIDNMTELDPADDAAYMNWGPSWCMPSREQCQELKDNCTWQKTNSNGVDGQLVIGPNGNSLFLPAAGDRWGSSFYGTGSDCYYWSRSLDISNSEFAYYFFYHLGDWGYWNDGSRDDGFSVRAVRVSED